MKFLTLFASFFALILSPITFAHTDDILGESFAHAIYHGIFWLILAAVVIKGIVWYKNLNKHNNK